jgi:hypothetical protein
LHEHIHEGGGEAADFRPHFFFRDDLDVVAGIVENGKQQFGAVLGRQDRDALAGNLVEDRELEQEAETARRAGLLQAVLEAEFLQRLPVERQFQLDGFQIGLVIGVRDGRVDRRLQNGGILHLCRRHMRVSLPVFFASPAA